MASRELAPSSHVRGAVVVTALAATSLSLGSGLFLASYIAESITWAEPVPSFPVRATQCFPLAVFITAIIFTLLCTLVLVVRKRHVGYAAALVVGLVVGVSAWFAVLISRPGAVGFSVAAFLVSCAASALAVPLGRLFPNPAAA